MPTVAPSPPRRPISLPAFLEPMLLIVAAILGIGVVYRATLSIPVTLIAAALAAVVAVAAPTRRRVYLYPTRSRNHPVD
jgi:Na+/H+ antiporter NhaD/arsenite permease-like protein